MPLSYDPKDVEKSGGPEPGDYPFKVVSSSEKTFKTGSEGLELTIEFIAGDRILTTWCRFPYAKRLKKLQEVCKCLGLGFDPPPDAKDFLHKSGTAFFEKDERGFLDPETFHPKKGEAQKTATSSAFVTEEDVPF